MKTQILATAMLLLTSPLVRAQEAEALAAINAHRAAQGCTALTVNAQLQAAAEQHARNMAEQDFFGHKGKDGSKFSHRLKAQGYRGLNMAENIAAGQKSGAAVVADWMGSSGHRTNILNCGYSETGIAHYHQPDDQPIAGNSRALKHYWVQTFGSP